ncbi:hypothetical protein QM314_16490, partial [Acinetobacter baumannii]|nr:hypothetical protein [Acinetobacter baumannii]
RRQRQMSIRERDIHSDREGSFEKQINKKNQTSINSMDEKKLTLYEKGMNNREIVDIKKEM